MKKRQAIVIELDGLSAEYVVNPVGADQPFFSSANIDGHFTLLSTRFPGREANRWSMITGLNPGWHGRFIDRAPDPTDSWGKTLFKQVVQAGGRSIGQDDFTAGSTEPEITLSKPDQVLDWLAERIDSLSGKCEQTLNQLSAQQAEFQLIRFPELAEIAACSIDLFNFNHPAFRPDISDKAIDIFGELRRNLRILTSKATKLAGDDLLVLVVCLLPPMHCRFDFSLQSWLSENGYSERVKAWGGHLQFLMVGRDEKGRVQAGKEAADLAAELTGKLMEITNPIDKTQVIRKAYRAADLYSGDHFNQAPNLYLDLFPGYRMTTSDAAGPIKMISGFGGTVRSPQIGRRKGWLFSSGSLAAEDISATDIHRSLADWLELPRDRYSEGENFLA